MTLNLRIGQRIIAIGNIHFCQHMYLKDMWTLKRARKNGKLVNMNFLGVYLSILLINEPINKIGNHAIRLSGQGVAALVSVGVFNCATLEAGKIFGFFYKSTSSVVNSMLASKENEYKVFQKFTLDKNWQREYPFHWNSCW